MKQLILEFSAKAQEEVTAVCKARALCKRWNAPAPAKDPKKSLYEANTDAEETPKKWTKSTPASTALVATKPPPSAAAGRAPKGSDIKEVKDLDDNELDYHDDMDDDDVGGEPSKTQETLKDGKS